MDGSIPVRFVLSKRTFYITLSFPSQGSFRLSIWDGKTLWEGEKSGQSLADLIPEGMDIQSYFSILKEAFSVQDKETKRFNYGIARHPTIKTDALLKWIIKTNVDPSEDEDEDALIPIDMCGEIHLAVVPEDRAKKLIQGMMDLLISNRNELESESKSLRDLNEILKSQRKVALSLLERLEQEKRTAEVELFSKFVLILNAKKAKIKELRSQLKVAQSTTRPPHATLSSMRSSQHTDIQGHRSQAFPSPPPVPLQGSLGDPLSLQFDSNDVYSLSITPKRSPKLKLDVFASSAPRISDEKPKRAPQNLFDLHTPSSLASHSSTLKRQGSHGGRISRQTSAVKLPTEVQQRAVSAKRTRNDDVLSLEEDEDFLLPEPKKWRY